MSTVSSADIISGVYVMTHLAECPLSGASENLCLTAYLQLFLIKPHVAYAIKGLTFHVNDLRHIRDFLAVYI